MVGRLVEGVEQILVVGVVTLRIFLSVYTLRRYP